MITWFLVGCAVWNLIGLIAALGSVIFWAFMWLLWKMAPATAFDHLCNGPSRSTPPSLPPRINGQMRVPGLAAVGVIVGILVLVAVPPLVLIARKM